MRLFTTAHDYSTFEQILAETLKQFNLRICAYCIIVVTPRGQVQFFTVTVQLHHFEL